jgi:hypothetical protein
MFAPSFMVQCAFYIQNAHLVKLVNFFFCFMIIKYSGSIAVHLGKKADEQATHRWSLFVRGPNHEDLSCFVEKVAFTLHPSFPEPVRGTVFSICLFIDLWCCVF